MDESVSGAKNVVIPDLSSVAALDIDALSASLDLDPEAARIAAADFDCDLLQIVVTDDDAVLSSEKVTNHINSPVAVASSRFSPVRVLS